MTATHVIKYMSKLQLSKETQKKWLVPVNTVTIWIGQKTELTG